MHGMQADQLEDDFILDDLVAVSGDESTGEVELEDEETLGNGSEVSEEVRTEDQAGVSESAKKRKRKQKEKERKAKVRLPIDSSVNLLTEIGNRNSVWLKRRNLSDQFR
jgi:protein CMS1